MDHKFLRNMIKSALFIFIIGFCVGSRADPISDLATGLESKSEKVLGGGCGVLEHPSVCLVTTDPCLCCLQVLNSYFSNASKNQVDYIKTVVPRIRRRLQDFANCFDLNSKIFDVYAGSEFELFMMNLLEFPAAILQETDVLVSNGTGGQDSRIRVFAHWLRVIERMSTLFAPEGWYTPGFLSPNSLSWFYFSVPKCSFPVDILNKSDILSARNISRSCSALMEDENGFHEWTMTNCSEKSINHNAERSRSHWTCAGLNKTEFVKKCQSFEASLKGSRPYCAFIVETQNIPFFPNNYYSFDGQITRGITFSNSTTTISLSKEQLNQTTGVIKTSDSFVTLIIPTEHLIQNLHPLSNLSHRYQCLRLEESSFRWNNAACTSTVLSNGSLKCLCDREGTFTFVRVDPGIQFPTPPTTTIPKTECKDGSKNGFCQPVLPGTDLPNISPVFQALLKNYSADSLNWTTESAEKTLEAFQQLSDNKSVIAFDNIVAASTIIQQIVKFNFSANPEAAESVINTTINIFDALLQLDVNNGTLGFASNNTQAQQVEKELYESLEKITDHLPVRSEPYEFPTKSVSMYALRMEPGPNEEYNATKIKNAISINGIYSRSFTNCSFHLKNSQETNETADAASFLLKPEYLKAKFESSKNSVPPGIFSVTVAAFQRFQYVNFDHGEVFSGSKSRMISPIMMMAKLSETVVNEPGIVSFTTQPDLFFLSKEGNRFYGAKRYACVYFDLDRGVWSNKGCKVKRKITTWEEPGTTIECECDHLSQFTLFFYLCNTLVDLQPINSVDSSRTVADDFLEPRFIATVSMSISITFCLVVLVHMSLNLRKMSAQITPQNFARLNVVISLFCSNTAFLIAEYIPEIPNAGYPGACLATALFSHWLLLSSFFWMVVESYILVEVLRGNINPLAKFAPIDNFDGIRSRFAIFGWGTPMLFPLISGLSHIQSLKDDFSGPAYGSLTLWCWIDPEHLGFFIGTLAAPVCIIVLLNISVFTYCIITRESKGSKLEIRRKAYIKRTFIEVIGTCFLLGATWLSGYFLLMFCCDDTAKKVAGGLFFLLNTSQGVFMFWVYALRLNGGCRTIFKDFKSVAERLSRQGTSTSTRPLTNQVGNPNSKLKEVSDDILSLYTRQPDNGMLDGRDYFLPLPDYPRDSIRPRRNRTDNERRQVRQQLNRDTEWTEGSETFM